MTSATQTATVIPGLHIEKYLGNCGFVVLHDASGRQAIPPLRLRRQAESALAELATTGIDFTATPRDIALHSAYREILHRWDARAKSRTHDPETGEFCNPYVTYGRCPREVARVPGMSCPRCGRM